MRKFLQRWKEQQSNRGSSLVLTMSIVSIIGILTFTLLTISLITYKMKNTNMNSKKNFYDAEKIMDDISLGLQEDISAAAGEAYTYTLTNFSANSADESKRRSNYVGKFQQLLLQRILDSSADNTYALHYDVNHLTNLVSAEARAQASTFSVDAASSDNFVNQDINAGTFTLKNVQVTYTDLSNYTTQIKTDIVLSCPKLNFDQNSTVPLDLTTYALVANDQTDTAGTGIKINGSAYLGNKGAEINAGHNVHFENPDDSGTSRVITAGNVNVGQGASIEVDDKYQLWARSLVLNACQPSAIRGQTYLNNDIILNTIKDSDNNYIGSDLTLAGSLFAYGNPRTSYSAEAYREVSSRTGVSSGERFQKASEPFYSDGDLTSVDSELSQSLLQKREADFSSAILVNGRKAKVNLSGLSEMVLAGNSYVGASLKDNDQIHNTDIRMGESISLKSDQRAYLVPAEFIAPYCEKYGGRNPMSEAVFTELNNEIVSKLNYSSTNDIQLLDYVRTDVGAVSAVPEKLARQGVVGIRQAVYRITMGGNTQNMVYFFLVFSGEESANTFAKDYWNSNLSTLKGHLYPNFNEGQSLAGASSDVDISYPVGLNLESPGSFKTYFNGGVLLPDGDDTKFYAGMLSQTHMYPNLETDELNFQSTYASLRHKLSVTGITDEEGKKTVYENLVISDMSNNTLVGTPEEPKTGILVNQKRVFQQDGAGDEKMCAVVVNGNYELKANAKEGDYPIRVIIAKGDVTIKQDCKFSGLLIAGGKVTIEQGASVSSNPSLAQQALTIKDSTTSTCAADFLINGSMYILGNDDGTNSDTDEVNFSDYVSYSNWSKQ